MPLIAAENLRKDYQAGEVTVKALKEISFEIEPSSFVSFVGPSGSGKTTLLNLIGCLDKPTGEATYTNLKVIKNLHQLGWKRGDTLLYQQEYALNPKFVIG